jgi:hypothetical protein
MRIAQRSWWLAGILLFLVCGGLIFATYWFGWSKTGFLSKSLWDWMQLLIIPFVLAIAAFLFNRAERKNEQEIALDNQRETALQAYLDKMSEILL